MFLGDNDSTRSHKLKNGTLFDLLSMNIINVINAWIIEIEQNETFNTVGAHIKIPFSPVPHMKNHKHWIPYIHFGNYLMYQETKFHLAYRYYVKSSCGFGPDTNLLEHNNACIY